MKNLLLLLIIAFAKSYGESGRFTALIILIAFIGYPMLRFDGAKHIRHQAN